MLKINEVNRLYLGIQGENNARTIEIDMNEWVVSYPNATVSIWHKRNGDVVPSPTGAAYDPDTGIISWTLTNTDTYVAGEGLAEVRMTENGVIKKTGKIITGVSQSVTGAGTPLGSDWQSYIDLIEGYKDDAQTAQGAAEDAAEDAEDSAEDAESWAVGQRGGTDVEDTDPTYHNNAKYYAQQAGGSATDAAGAKTAAETAQGKAEAAQGKAEAAQGKAETAQEKAETAQGKAEAARNQYPKIDDVSGNWKTYDPENEQYVDTGVHAQGETGATGQTGPQGPAGAVPNITIGTVTTLQPGSDATVERRSGSPDTAPVFDFGIPEGEAGETGETGATPEISIGTVTTLQPDQSAYVTLDPSSTPEAPVMNFGIPKGDTGQAGNVYGNTIDMSSSDTTKVSAAIGAKAAKVSSATSGNFAGLDSNGDLTDSGSKAADFILASTKGAAAGVAELDANSKLKTSQSAKGTIVGLYSGETVTTSGTTKYHDLKFTVNDYTLKDGNVFPIIFRSSVTLTYVSGYTNKLRVQINGGTATTLSIDGSNQIGTNKIINAGIYWVCYYATNTVYLMRTSGLSSHTINGKTIGEAIEKNVDASISAGTSSANLPTSAAVDSYVSGQISGKAEKVSGATSGNFAGLDANGNLTDSGKKASDFATLNSTLREVPVAVAVADWTLSSGVYSAEFTTAYVTSTSKEWLVFDDSYKTYAKESVTSEKKSGGGGIILQTTVIPTGTITGTLSVIDADDGKVPVLIEDTVTPIANGGTGQSSLAGAQQALGITEINTNIANIGPVHVTGNAISGTNPFTMTTETGHTYLIIITSSNMESFSGVWIAQGGSSNAYCLEIKRSTYLAMTTSGTTITITKSSSQTVRATVFDVTI